jgi:hypothetical protein
MTSPGERRGAVVDEEDQSFDFSDGDPVARTVVRELRDTDLV